MRPGRASRVAILALLAGCAEDRREAGFPVAPITARDWPQWAHDAGHSGEALVAGQAPRRIVAEVVNDPLAEASKRETGGRLLAHYAVPLLVGDEAYVSFQGGQVVACAPPGSGQPAPCGPDAWERQTWSVRRLRLDGADLAALWSFESDWKPPPNGGALGGWEPVFQAALSGDFLYVPGFAGSVHKLARRDGSVARRIEPFAADPSSFVAGPLVADARGNLYYHVLRLDLADPWRRDVLGAWLVRIGADDRVTLVRFADLVAGAPAPAELCTGSFRPDQLPWPPSPTARPVSLPCGAQRPGLNVAPAVAPSGVVYTVSRAHLSSRHGYLVALGPDLAPLWAASLRDRLLDGCGSALLPPSGTPGGCRAGAGFGVDPATNELPAAQVVDLSSSSPVVAPDGSVLYGAFTRYNGARGHLLRFAADGRFLSSYDYGWDLTPAIWRHGATYSVVIKDNRYGLGSYCNDPVHCPRGREGPHDIAQLDPSLGVEWTSTNRSTESCRRTPSGGMSCIADHPDGFEWCVNAPAVAADGAVYANAEDGYLHVIEQGGQPRGSIFLDAALGAAYTPVALDRDGRIYAQNNGRLFAIGE